VNESTVSNLDAFERQVEHRFVDNGGVQLHYAVMGSGPLVVLLHGFPDYWLTWRHQMAALANSYRVAALDLRGYNLSDRPAGVENYSFDHLLSDVTAMISDLGETRTVVVGHDVGGFVAWNLAMNHPSLVGQLIVLNTPHPSGLYRELAHNPKQQAASQYARNLQHPMAHTQLPLQRLSQWVTDSAERERHQRAMERSDLQAMLNFYKANYPPEPYRMPDLPLPLVQAPTLMIFGSNDPYLLVDALNGTWHWVARELTMVTVPGAGHFIQQDAAELVSKTILSWLNSRIPRAAA